MAKAMTKAEKLYEDYKKLSDKEKYEFYKLVDGMGGIETYTVGNQIDEFMEYTEAPEEKEVTYEYKILYNGNCIMDSRDIDHCPYELAEYAKMDANADVRSQMMAWYNKGHDYDADLFEIVIDEICAD